MTSLAGTWGRSSAVGISAVSRSEAGVPGLIMPSRGEVMVPVSTSRRLMSSRTNAALDAGGGLGQGGAGPAGDGDLVEPVLQVIQGQAGAQPDPHAFPHGGGACPQDQRQAAGAVGDDELGEAGPDAVPGDQAPGGLVDAVADRLDGGGDADDDDDGGEPEGQGGVVGELDPAEDQAAGESGFGCPPPDGADDGPGGNDSGGDRGEDSPEDQASEQGEERLPFAGGDGGGQGGRDDKAT